MDSAYELMVYPAEARLKMWNDISRRLHECVHPRAELPGGSKEGMVVWSSLNCLWKGMTRFRDKLLGNPWRWRRSL